MKAVLERIVMVLPYPKQQPMKTCNSCGKRNEGWRTSCFYCGTSV